MPAWKAVCSHSRRGLHCPPGCQQDKQVLPEHQTCNPPPCRSLATWAAVLLLLLLLLAQKQETAWRDERRGQGRGCAAIYKILSSTPLPLQMGLALV